MANETEQSPFWSPRQRLPIQADVRGLPSSPTKYAEIAESSFMDKTQNPLSILLQAGLRLAGGSLLKTIAPCQPAPLREKKLP